MMDGVPLTTKDVVLPSDIPEVPLVDSPKKRPQPESTNPEVKPEPTEIQIKTEPTTIKLEPIDDTSLETSPCKPQGQKSVPEPMPALDRTFSQLSVIAYEPPRRNRPELARIEEEAMGNFEMDQDHLYAAQQPELSDQLDELQEQHAEPTDPRSLELPAVEHLHAKKVRTIEEERERYRKKLSKGLKQKHEVYLSKYVLDSCLYSMLTRAIKGTKRSIVESSPEHALLLERWHWMKRATLNLPLPCSRKPSAGILRTKDCLKSESFQVSERHGLLMNFKQGH